MLKDEREYNEKYGTIPLDYTERLEILLKSIKRYNKRNPNYNIYDELKKIQDIKWNTIKFTIYLVPKATPRPRANMGRNIFYVKGAANNKKRFLKFLENNPHEMIFTPMKFTLDSYLPIPSSMNSREKALAEMGAIRPTSKPDFDNVAKTYSDMLQGSLIYDDALIVEGVSRKWYSMKPRIEITIEYMESFDSLFNKNKIQTKLQKGEETEK